jgi:hypothetical protein
MNNRAEPKYSQIIDHDMGIQLSGAAIENRQMASVPKTLQEMRKHLKSLQDELKSHTAVFFGQFERDGRVIDVFVTDALYKNARRENEWASGHMVSALRNAQYGFNLDESRSNGGRDGIFILDRDYSPENSMMRKIFDKFLDNPRSSATAVAEFLGTTKEQLVPVRLVHHHIRLLGVLARRAGEDLLVLVDLDKEKSR